MTQENLFTPDCIRTVSGQYVNVFNPDPETILIEDIAHALSRQCRFGSHLPMFYSVAEHCINVAEKLPSGMQLAGLLHDASEAYLLDIPSPIKARLTNYREIENRLMEIIAEKFGFQWPLHVEVKQMDELMLHQEWYHLMIGPNFYFPAIRTMDEANVDFLEYFKRESND